MKKICVWLLPVLFAFITIILSGCHEAVNPDVYEEYCKSDKPVPINCEKFTADDYSGKLEFAILEIDKVEINYSTITIPKMEQCQKKSLKKTSGYYFIIMDCKNSFFNKNISATLEFDYMFMGKNKHTSIAFKRLFGKKDPFLDRAPIDDYSTQYS